MRNKASPAEYLAFLSVKYEVDPDELFGALISAGRNRKSTCGNLSIERRGERKDMTVLLITRGSKALAQFPVPREFLSEQNNPIKAAQESDAIRKYVIRKNGNFHSYQIKDLRTGMKRINLRANVVEIAEPAFVFTRFGNYASVANALISDETGEIKLCLWNEQIKSVCIGDRVQIKNASISTFRGEKQLRIGKKGTLQNLRNMVDPIEAHSF